MPLISPQSWLIITEEMASDYLRFNYFHSSISPASLAYHHHPIIITQPSISLSSSLPPYPSRTMNILSEWTSTVFGPPHQRNLPVIIGTTALTTLALYKLMLESSKATTPEVIESPASTLLKGLSEKEIGELPYPPDALPGGRSVESPVGYDFI